MPFYPEGYEFGEREGKFLIYAALTAQVAMGVAGMVGLAFMVYLGIKLALS